MIKAMTEEQKMTQKVRDTDTIFEVKLGFNTTYIAMEVFQNLPEASMSLSCTGWKYGDKDPKEFKFTFEDEEEYDENDKPKRYTVKIADAEKGVAKVIEQILAGKLFVGGLSTMEDLMDLGNWDAEVVDACVQCAIFGEVIYG
jgi:hypothetical protein